MGFVVWRPRIWISSFGPIGVELTFGFWADGSVVVVVSPISVLSWFSFTSLFSSCAGAGAGVVGNPGVGARLADKSGLLA